MKKHRYVWFLIFGIIILIVPTAVYLAFLIPRMSEEYDILMASGGVICGGGMYGASAIPDSVKFSGLYKLSARSFTLLVITTLVREFITEIIFLAAVVVVSYIVYRFLLEAYRDGKRKQQGVELAKEIARNVVETTK